MYMKHDSRFRGWSELWESGGEANKNSSLVAESHIRASHWTRSLAT
jgi:hypothetical protein